MKDEKIFVLSNEVLANVIAKVNVLANNDNKVRFSVGLKDTGNGLQSMATIVNGGAMIRVGFLTMQPKKPVEIPEGAPYAQFILKAKDFAAYAGALLPYKADVTVTETADKVVFSVGDGAKVPVAKVGAESAEPLLEEDYGAAIAQIKGEALMDTLERGGFASTLAEANSVNSAVYVNVSGQKALVYSAANYGVSSFSCPVEIKFNKKDGEATAEGKEEAQGESAKTFICRYAKGLGEEERAAFKAELSLVVNDPEKVNELAEKYGWKKTDAPAAPKAASEQKADEVSFALSSANWRLFTKLYGGQKAVAVCVTPKNVHVLGGGLKATFALGTVNPGVIGIIGQMDKVPKNARFVVDRDALLGALTLMKLGEKGPCAFKAAKASLGIEKVGAGINGRVPFLATEGEISGVKGGFNGDLLSQFVGTLKAGNLTFSFSSPTAPIILSSGNLETEVTGFHVVMGVKLADKAEAEAE